MSPDQVSTFLALLALTAIGLVLVVVATWRHPVRAELAGVALPVALAVAATATAGSLYYSEVAHYTPCELCWYQRIAMYPLTLMLGIALWRGDHRIARYAIPQAAIGLAISVYHYQLQLFPEQGSSCDASAPCTFQWVDKFGFVSIPFMAGCGFAVIIALLAVDSTRPAPTLADTTRSSEAPR